MSVFVLGINHRTAPLEVRERVAFVPEQMADALNAARNEAGLHEVAILSTCNRTEIYGSAEVPVQVLPWLGRYHHVEEQQLQACHYLHEGAATVRHMMKVASGLDSMVLGEPQILGQLKSCYAVARDVDAIDSQLDQLFQQAFATAKRVRTETAIGQNPVSVSYAAVSLSQQIFADLNEVSALLIGAGETIELVARHLKEKGVGSITVANRTLRHAQELAEQFGAEAILLSDIPEQLHRADVVISSTASQLPILGKGAVESALKKRRHRPMFMVDIAVPRDIEPEVAELGDVYLYTVDDLQEVIDENLRSREDAANVALEIVEEGVESWARQVRAQGAVDTIRAVRQSVEQVRDSELEKALRALQAGQNAEDVMKSLARSLTNKLLHTPTTRLKQASEDGHTDHIQWAQDLFGLDLDE
jgi:glutamyl-tRNA reductase